MGKYRKNPKYNVVSIRVTNEEKALLEEITRRDRTTITSLMREAMSFYTSAQLESRYGSVIHK